MESGADVLAVNTVAWVGGVVEFAGAGKFVGPVGECVVPGEVWDGVVLAVEVVLFEDWEGVVGEGLGWRWGWRCGGCG